ncbi:MAG TPA: hypothetical protein PKZ36_00370 [Candidatus Paceibacterota bacterium]|nr:hypothetical protein [Candidatus Paceibacterota bacterium]HPT17855.1 hypothetical protein [Candidatus Paceibacterota bacterium]
MEPDDRKLLERTLEIAEENNKLLRKVRGVQKWRAFWTIAKLVIIIAIGFGAFYYLEPYIGRVTNTFNSFSGAKQNIDSYSIQNMLKNM